MRDLARRRRRTNARDAGEFRPAGTYAQARRGIDPCARGRGGVRDLVARRAGTLAPQGYRAAVAPGRPAIGGRPQRQDRVPRGLARQSGRPRPLRVGGVPALRQASRLLWRGPPGQSLRCAGVQESAGQRRDMPCELNSESCENERAAKKTTTISFGRTLGLLSGLVGNSIHMKNLIVTTPMQRS